MASQMGIVTRSKRRRDQIAELEARQSLLPQMIANQNRKEDLARQDKLQNLQIEQWDKNYALEQEKQVWERKAYRQNKNANERANRMGMGMEAAKLGLNINTQYGDKSLGELSTSVFSKSGSTSSTPAPGSWGEFANKVPIGSAIGGGLTGYGASRLVSNKKKGKKFAIGAGAGALAGFLSGGPSGALAGGIGGGFGSLF